MKPQPDLVVFLKRLFYLEGTELVLTDRELRELNGLRLTLSERWPYVMDALIAAYLGIERSRP